MKAYVIHMERATERRKQIDRICVALSIPVEIVPAVDGAALSDETFRRRYRRSLLAPWFPFELRAGEIGCFLSHRKCWELIAASDDDGAVIIEDDVEVDSRIFNPLLTFVSQKAGREAYVRFPLRAGREAGPVVIRDHGFSLTEPLTPGLGTVCQYVGKDVARSLLQMTEQFDRPVDGFLQMRFHHRLKIWTADPVAVSDASGSLGNSLIQGHAKPLPERIRREISRFAYRLKLKNRNKRSK